MSLWSPTSPVEETASPFSPPPRQAGRRFAQIVKLKPEFIDKYKEVQYVFCLCRTSSGRE